MEWDIKSLLESKDISYTCAGTDRKVKGAAAISVAEDTDLSFCYHVGEKGFSLISQSNAGIIICNSSMEGLISPKVNSEGTKQLLVFTNNPRLAFVRALNMIYNKKKLVGISSRASVS
ncbi:MAG: LpxD N-terminal domain-containing protein, partial [Nitrososphaeraceae archaeon]